MENGFLLRHTINNCGMLKTLNPSYLLNYFVVLGFSMLLYVYNVVIIHMHLDIPAIDCDRNLQTEVLCGWNFIIWPLGSIMKSFRTSEVLDHILCCMSRLHQIHTFSNHSVFGSSNLHILLRNFILEIFMYWTLFTPNFIGIAHLYDEYEAKYIWTNVAVSHMLCYFCDAQVDLLEYPELLTVPVNPS